MDSNSVNSTISPPPTLRMTREEENISPSLTSDPLAVASSNGVETKNGFVSNSNSNSNETENKYDVQSQTQSSYKARVSMFEQSISGERIDFEKVRQYAFAGVPDYPGLRSIYWKILLGYLPNIKSEWKSVLEKNRKLYKGFAEELTIDPRRNEPDGDHPLSQNSSSQWHMFFKDKDLLDEIDKDVKRTLPHLHFFNHDKQVGDTTHYEALKRILFIYAKLNPGIRYVQGMNEILGPLYYIFANDPNPDFKENAEIDTFFCFTNVMSEIRDNFCKTLDKSSIGIQGQMAKLSSLLMEKDRELCQNLESKGVNTHYYGFRWITLLLSQEFDLPDVLRLWDSLFADEYRFQFLLYVCLAMIVSMRERLLDGSFADNLKLLQNYPLQDIHVVLTKAEEILSPSYQPPVPRTKPSISSGHHGNGSLSSGLQKGSYSKQTPSAKVSVLLSPEEEQFANLSSTTHPTATESLKFPKPPKPFDDDDSGDED